MSQSPDDAVAAREHAQQADNRLSTRIAMAREMAERARAEAARCDIRWRVGGTWVTIEDLRARPNEQETLSED